MFGERSDTIYVVRACRINWASHAPYTNHKLFVKRLMHLKPVSARRARIERMATEGVAMAAIHGALAKAWLLAHVLCLPLSLSARAAAGGGGGGFDVLVGAGGLGFVGIGHVSLLLLHTFVVKAQHGVVTPPDSTQCAYLDAQISLYFPTRPLRAHHFMQLNNPSHYREHTRQQDGWTVLAPPPQETSELPPPYTPLVGSGHDWKEAALNVEREGLGSEESGGWLPACV
ncbi:hypothetical protein FB451DRAFT_1363655 [Mycena latifolia]|nr:hypothetical protein FB451DRAFT_1363655 [Mycena latifolia]